MPAINCVCYLYDAVYATEPVYFSELTDSPAFQYFLWTEKLFAALSFGGQR